VLVAGDITEGRAPCLGNEADYHTAQLQRVYREYTYKEHK
jgi:hypothetical protein